VRKGRALRSELAWLHARISRLEVGTSRERVMTPPLREQLRETERDWQRLLRELREQAGISAGAATGAAGPSLGEDLDALRENLPDGWGFLAFHVGPDFAVALAVDKSRVVMQPLSADLARTLERCTDQLDFQWGAAALEAAWLTAGTGSDRPAEFPENHPLLESTRAVLRDLYQAIWEPLASVLRDRSWIISPHGMLHRIPFPALLGPNGYLVEETCTAMTPSARVWNGIAARGRKTNRKSAWIGGVASADLPAVHREIESVAAHLTSWKVQRDTAPTRSGFLTATSEADLIHLAAHGALRTDNPAFSQLRLVDGPLFVHDVSELRLPESVVVLTACSSGRGERLVGDEWVGLAQGFLQAGASTVVTSLWPIEDRATAALMDGFYRRLSAGASIPESLRSAMLETGRVLFHPWQWASFSSSGAIAGHAPETGESLSRRSADSPPVRIPRPRRKTRAARWRDGAPIWYPSRVETSTARIVPADPKAL
jgi:hypothetical protein